MFIYIAIGASLMLIPTLWAITPMARFEPDKSNPESERKSTRVHEPVDLTTLHRSSLTTSRRL